LLPILHKILLVVFYVGLGLSLLSNIVGLPGNWMLVAAALVVALATGFAKVTLTSFFLCLGLAILGEAIESLLGAVIVAKHGGSKLGVIGSIAGGFTGVVFVGAFLGAVLGEILRHPETEFALRIGFWSFIGRMSAMAAKFSVGCVILWILIETTWS